MKKKSSNSKLMVSYLLLVIFLKKKSNNKIICLLFRKLVLIFPQPNTGHFFQGQTYFICGDHPAVTFLPQPATLTSARCPALPQSRASSFPLHLLSLSPIGLQCFLYF